MTIRLLPPEVAAKIAAGEVVERPASVVKELVENSIDAGASEIRVEIREGGRRLIRVADDGCGIPAGEAELAFARHATSKLSDVSDLERVETLGFRGEALASIAAVSQVTLLTRQRQEPMGQFLRIDGGQIAHQEGRGAPAGTVVTVEHLFRNVPARLKFLRQPSTEAGHIHTIVTYYALAYPQVRFGLTTDGRPGFQSTGSGSLLDVLIALYGLEVAEQMIEITAGEPPGGEAAAGAPARVTGYVGVPALHRANRRYITLFVNRRWIQDRALTHAVAQAYHSLLPVGRHPVAVVLLEIDPGEVDVNVHPTKREVKFRDGRKAFSAVQRAVRRTLIEHAPVPDVSRAPRTWPAPDWERRQALLRPGQGERPTSQMAMELYRTAGGGPALAPEDEAGRVGPVRLPLLRVVGQVGQTYIIAEGPQGMYLIDQHAAHERVLYEQMMAQHGQRDVASQTLLEPLVLDLDPLLAGVLDEHRAMLNELGFQIEPFGRSSFLLRAVASALVVPDVQAAMVDILELLRQGDDLLASQAEERLISAVCKRAAIKAGQTLSLEEMQELIRQLEQCESPRTCPHGRPTVLHFSVEQLEKEFGRR